MNTINRALISVSDKTGIVEFCRALKGLDVQLLSTGGTALLLREAGIEVTDVSEHTGFPEILDGRVKTLHPRIHGGILARRDLTSHMDVLAAHDIPPIDLVVVNLYPFRQPVARLDCDFVDAIENIDNGGAALLRAAAKNHAGCAVVVDPADYPDLAAELAASGGRLSEMRRRALATKAFTHTARYDGAIANWLSSLDADSRPGMFPEHLQLGFDRVATLRYGENPHQQAAFYRDPDATSGGIAGCRVLQGKELSYNNLADADAAWECAKSFDADESGPACVIVKHANPCGVAVAGSPDEAYRRAFATDPTSAFGGIIAFNVSVDVDTALAVTGQFVEVLIAPAYTEAARAVLAGKPNLRVLEVASLAALGGMDCRRIGGGLLVQTHDLARLDPANLKVVTRRAPDAAQWRDLLFAWAVARHVKSNAIVHCRGQATLGVGAGQMSRIDSARIAALKARSAGLELAGSAVASDAFFPFRDGVDVLAESGAAAIIQPGGSVRDAEVIAAADEHGMAMVFTGMRHFRH